MNEFEKHVHEMDYRELLGEGGFSPRFPGEVHPDVTGLDSYKPIV